MNLKEVSRKYEQYVIDMRRHFHMYPEPSKQEFETSKKIREELDKMSIPYEVVATTGVIGRIKGKNPGKKVLLRADFDALEVTEKTEVEYKSKNEGVMHACGHDAHTAMLLGAAKVLNEIKDNFDGEVILFFQPAEELGWGAKAMVDETNINEEIDGAFGIHIWSEGPSGKISCQPGERMAAADMFKIIVEGSSGHGSLPNQTIDATVVGSAIVMNLQSIVSRNTSPLDSLVVTVGKMVSGTRFNVISGTCELEGTVRSFNKEVWADVPNKIKRVVENTAAAYGAKATLEYNRITYPLINDEKVSKIARDAITKLYGDDVLFEEEKTPGGEDFAYVIDKSKEGAFAFLGARNDEKGCNYPHHHEKFNVDEDALIVGVDMYTSFAIDYLKH